MSEKTNKRGDSPIEFVAPHPLTDCIYRILDTQTPAEGITHPGYKPSVEKIEAGRYRFQIAVRYAERERNRSPLISIEGHLNEVSETSTSVSAEVRVGGTGLILSMGLSMILLALFIPLMPTLIAIIVQGGLAAFWLWFLTRVRSDSRALVNLLYKTLTNEIPH